MQKIKLGLFLIPGMMLASCNNESATTHAQTDSASAFKLDFTAEPAPEWSSLFYRNHGWFGGDGIFAVTRDGSEAGGASVKSETMIWFSDTMFGDIKSDSLQPGYGMINNSMAL